MASTFRVRIGVGPMATAAILKEQVISAKDVGRVVPRLVADAQQKKLVRNPYAIWALLLPVETA